MSYFDRPFKEGESAVLVHLREEVEFLQFKQRNLSIKSKEYQEIETKIQILSRQMQATQGIYR